MCNYNLKNDLSIKELALPIRTVNALNRAQITTLQQLQMLSIQELIQIRGIGEIGLQTLLSACEKYSIHIPSKPAFPTLLLLSYYLTRLSYFFRK